MKKLTLIIAVLIFLQLGLLIHPQSIEAAKKRIRSTGGGVRVTTGNYSKVSIYPSRLGTIITFFNLDKVSKVSYVLSYTGSGKPQGIVGSFVPSVPSDSRELLFGTCSSGACVYHEGVTTARLTINFTLKSGGVYTKRYILKVHK
ncbi:hypothetical protein A2773_06465 [Candidatus Gottesmanbacteria bacterium RIFCSPHIGHO2_01_FULL_39_10]|uniref:Uncharacterized protein n=1 Tax=Candidatus Gottesmanbacteria bacterium RIFCSPHIGHO2_01_FULL_39_10 TaxID=1798375 RepID=A0A1F5ZQ52_9BACT|nr:MAG: hypothetical protein A2773_06465 [Candidatus Gottesmanbacteria bacterium RIFCSPHIGHO2_01_FULL_39_10]